ncbi:aKG-HExxH-type peptide beta-hydroxylase [Nocardia flavorosea]|uniref:HEXXH motif-containing protein n=1 Tax=Nocardia flavorosea TaxID=53429 RepID=A0A846Y8P7_9NOCA|nr:HEXXH motif-containing putative peptide modification protein [Nocardia flavorosea]NKY55936.1 hypothetical protein [Nocardia flavorosea]
MTSTAAAVESGYGIFGAQPDPARARLLRTTVNTQLRDSLQAATDAAATVLPKQSAAARSAADALDFDRRIAPVIFSLHRQISSGVRDQDVTQVAIGLSRLRIHRDRDELYADRFELSPLQWDECDFETARYLYSPLGPREAGDRFGEMLPLPPDRFDEYADTVNQALDLIRISDLDMYGEIHELVAEIRLFEGGALRAVSSPRSFGLMHLSPPISPTEIADPTTCFVERIVHEASHIALNAAMIVDPLVLNDPADRFTSPLRPDPRPMSGIYHAAFVLSRVVHVLDRMHAHYDPPTLTATFDLMNAKFAETHQVVLDHAQLSAVGREVLDSCAALVAAATS